MADNNLTLIASVKDNASGPLQKISREAVALAKTRVDGTAESFNRLSNTIAPLAGQTRQVVGSMNLLGFATGGVITGLAAAASALNDFSKKSLAIRDFSKLTALSTREITQFTEASKRLGIDPEQSTAGLRVFSRNLADLKNRTGDLRAHLTRRGAGDIAGELTRLTQAGDNAGALDLVIKKIKDLAAVDTDKAARFAGDMFGDEELYKLYRYSDALKGIKPHIERNYEAAQKFRDSWITAEGSVTRFRNRLLGELLPAFNDLFDAAEKIDLGKIISDDVTIFIKKLSEAITDLRNISKGDFTSITPKFEKGGVLDGIKNKLDPINSRKNIIELKQKELSDTEGALSKASPGSLTERLMTAQKERLAKEISDLVTQIKKLSDETAATVKKMSFMNGSGGFGEGSITNASFGGFGQNARQSRGFGGGGYKLLDERGGAGGSGGGSVGSSPEGSNSPSGSGGGLAGRPGGENAGANPMGRAGGGSDVMSKPGPDGKYRKQYTPTEHDLSDAVVNTINGEAKGKDGTDAVINNMMNRVGAQKGWGSLRDVARAPGQYAGYSPANPKQAEMIRDRIKAIASGDVPDNTGGSNSFRAENYFRSTQGRGKGFWAGRSEIGPNVGGNRFAVDPQIGKGPYASQSGGGIGASADLGVKDTGNVGEPRVGGIPKARGVDPRIQDIINTASGSLPDGYKVKMTSGNRGEGNHNGNAADYQITTPDGKVLPNRGEDPTGMYTKLARLAKTAQQEKYPQLDGKFAWGGAFGTQKGGGGPRDIMHFDVNGERGRYAQHQLRNMDGLPLRRNEEATNTPPQRKPVVDESAGLNTSGNWRSQLDKGQSNEMTSKVEGTGKLTVDVNAPKGTKVGAEGGGLFKQIEISRNVQMGKASDSSSERMAPQ